MRVAGIFLMLAGFAVSRVALRILTAQSAETAFLAVALLMEITGLVFVARTHIAHNGDRID